MVTLIAWWLVGRTHLRRKRRRRRAASIELGDKLSDAQGDAKERLMAATGDLGVRTLPMALRQAVFPPSTGNRVVLLDSPQSAYASWIARIKAARHSYPLRWFYAWHDDAIGAHFRDLLIERARDGLEIRLIVDGIGSVRTPRRFFDPMREAGHKGGGVSAPATADAESTTELPQSSQAADHRWKCRFQRWGQRWRDVRPVGTTWRLSLEGPAVGQLQEVFVDDWYFCTGQELVDDPYFPVHELDGADGAVVQHGRERGPDQRWNAVREMLFVAITEAKHSAWLMTPYLIPDEALLIALRTAVYRGVDVRVVVPAKSDQLACASGIAHVLSGADRCWCAAV